MSNKGTNNLWVRITCFILAGLMVIGVATTAIFLIVNLFNHQSSSSFAIEEQAELPSYDEEWTV